jgi:Xanthomonas XOO_2897-like deaminase
LEFQLALRGVPNPGVAARAGNRVLRRMLQRAEDPPKPPLPPEPKPSGADMRELKTVQLNEMQVARQDADPALARTAREWRVKNTALDAKSFNLNVAVVKYRRSGRVYYKAFANDPAKLHSETQAVKWLVKSDPRWERTEILALFTERHPCANCGPDLDAVRIAIKNQRLPRGQSATDFPIYYSVPKWEPGATRAKDLREKYLGPSADPELNSPVRIQPPPDPASKPKIDPKTLVKVRKKGGGPGGSPPPEGGSSPAGTPTAGSKPPIGEAAPAGGKSAPATSSKTGGTGTSVHVDIPRINWRGMAKATAGTAAMFLIGLWLSRYTEEAIEDLLKENFKEMEPTIADRSKAQVEAVLSTGWANWPNRPDWYLYVTVDTWRMGVFEAELAGYDWGTPVASLISVIALPLRYGDGSWSEQDYRKIFGWDGMFERTTSGVMIEHHYYTVRTPLEKFLVSN